MPDILAPLNTNECPPPSARITVVATCQAAAVALGRTFGSSNAIATAPRGCYNAVTVAGEYVLFNTHAAGAAAADRQLLCLNVGTAAPTSAGYTGAPTVAPTFTWADASGERGGSALTRRSRVAGRLSVLQLHAHARASTDAHARTRTHAHARTHSP
jgi:hypothetical protein